MDIFGTAVSAAHAVHVAATTLHSLYKAPEEILELAGRVNNAQYLLERALSIYEDLPEAEKPGFRNLCTAPCEQYKSVADYLKNELTHEPGNGGLDRMSKSVKWMFRKKWIKGQIEVAQQQEQALEKMVALLTAGTAQKTSGNVKEVQESLEKLHQVVDYKRFRKCLEKLPHSDAKKTMETNLDKAANSVPDWVLDDASFREWSNGAGTDGSGMNGSGTNGSGTKWLWALGEAGAGKTCIASYVANHLMTSTPLNTSDVAGLSISDDQVVSPTQGAGDQSLDWHADDTAAAIFYFSYKATDPQDTDRVFKCLIRQLLFQLWDVNPVQAFKRLPQVEELVSELIIPGRKGERETPRSVLRKLAQDFAKAYIVIDALDENPSGFRDFLAALDYVRSEQAKVLITSRVGLRPEAAHRKSLILDVNQNTGTINRYLSQTLLLISQRKEQQLPFGIGASALPAVVSDPENRRHIVSKIAEAANGNFLYAELQIRALVFHDEERALGASLDNLSANSSLDELVESAIQRVEQLPGEDEDIGKLALLWSIYARKTLTLRELQHAIAWTKFGDTKRVTPETEAENYTLQRLMKTTCYFLQIDEKSVQIHKAVRDFCDHPDREKRYFADAHTRIAQACLCAISRTRPVAYQSQEGWNKAVSTSQFLEYAGLNWGWHMAQDDEKLLRWTSSDLNLLKMLQKPVYVNAMAIPLRRSQLGDMGVLGDDMWDTIKKKETPIPSLMVLAWFDLARTIEAWLEKHPDAAIEVIWNRRSPKTWTYDANSQVSSPFQGGFDALWVAASTNKVDAVRKLLEHGADPIRKNGNAETWHALGRAASQGWGTIVEALLEAADCTSVLRDADRPPIRDACWSGDAETVRLIMDAMEEMPDRTTTAWRPSTRRC
jgi:hypothetical protein